MNTFSHLRGKSLKLCIFFANPLPKKSRKFTFWALSSTESWDADCFEESGKRKMMILLTEGNQIKEMYKKTMFSNLGFTRPIQIYVGKS